MADHTSMNTKGGTGDFESRSSFAASALFKALFDQGMDLVKEAAAYLDGPGRSESKALGREANLLYSTESMLLTTRLMQMASWLLVHRAVGEGEMSAREAMTDKNRVAVTAPEARPAETLEQLPEGLRGLVERSQSMQERIVRLEQAIIDGAAESGAGGLSAQLEQLSAAFGPARAEGDS